MVTGYLAKKKGYWYVILNLYPSLNGSRKQKWISTGLRIQGNKRLAEEKLIQYRLEYTHLYSIKQKSGGLYFHDFMLIWLKEMEKELAPSSFINYSYAIKNRICPYFKEKGILLNEIEKQDIQSFYDYYLDTGLSGNTVLHYHNHIHKALDMAVEQGLLHYNPSDYVRKPKIKKFVVIPYSTNEANQLLEASGKTSIEVAVVLALRLGLRRSEILGLKWDAIDFENNVIRIMRTTQPALVDDKRSFVTRHKVKRESSFRTLPMMKSMKQYLKSIMVCRYNGKSPNFDDFICVGIDNKPLRPDYLTRAFSQLLETHQLRKIRFHDLRHSCAAILLADRTPLLEVQHWLGHSNISTTVDLYAHLDDSIKLRSAELLEKLKIPHIDNSVLLDKV